MRRLIFLQIWTNDGRRRRHLPDLRRAAMIFSMTYDLGPLAELMKDSSITEIMVNRWDTIYIERGGQLTAAPFRFPDPRALEELIQGLLFSAGMDIGKSLYFDGTFPDGTRFNVALPPFAANGPTLTIRKHGPTVNTLEKLVQKKALPTKVAVFLSAVVRARMNLLIAGGTGSGKTTLLNALAGAIPANERVITIEDTGELRLPLPHWVRLLTRTQGPVTMDTRQALMNSLRMRPDRIIVGEVRGAEAWDMLQAMNTGHDGSMTTIHANSSIDALTRLESLVLTTGIDLPLRSLRQNIAQALDVVVQLRRSKNGNRYVSEILEVTGVQGDVLSRATLFSAPEGAESGEALAPLGIVPSFMAKAEARGAPIPLDVFDPKKSR